MLTVDLDGVALPIFAESARHRAFFPQFAPQPQRPLTWSANRLCGRDRRGGGGVFLWSVYYGTIDFPRPGGVGLPWREEVIR